MGLRSWVQGFFDGSGAATEADEPAVGVDVERRAGAIMEHYDLPAADARRIAEILAEETTREAGYARRMIADRVARELDLPADSARRIVDTEVTSIRNLTRVRTFVRQGGEDVRVRWVDSVGHDDSDVCADVRRVIDERGAVTLGELREILADAAADHDAGTPDRAADLIPHEGCRHTVVRHVE